MEALTTLLPENASDKDPTAQGVCGGSLDDEAHANLVRAIIAHFRQHPNVRTLCEVPYNYYGQRGIVDIVALIQPTIGAQWTGIVCEVKPILRDIGGTVRQVRKAELYFSMPHHIAEYGLPRLRFPLILAATETNYLLAKEYADILDDIEIHFFSPSTAFNNPFEKEWGNRKTNTRAPLTEP